MEDRKIVELFLERQEEAVSCTADKYGHRLRSLSMGIVEDWGTAQECENDTYLQAWERIPPSKPYDYLLSFLARITRHISIDVCRRKRAQKRDGIMVELTQEMEQCIPTGHDPAAVVDQKLLGETISRYLQGLSAEKRTIFMRRYWCMEPVDEIADRLGITKAKVKVTLHRCRNELKSYLQKEGYDL